jgi:hypothetical protein
VTALAVASQSISSVLKFQLRLTSIRIHPSRAQSQRLDALGGELSGEFCHGHVHASLADRVTQQSGESGLASEIKISTLTGDEDHLLLCALANEVEE